MMVIPLPTIIPCITQATAQRLLLACMKIEKFHEGSLIRFKDSAATADKIYVRFGMTVHSINLRWIEPIDDGSCQTWRYRSSDRSTFGRFKVEFVGDFSCLDRAIDADSIPF